MTNETQIVEVLKNAGIGEKCALCLSALRGEPEGMTSLQIQKRINLRQPDISVSLNWLKANGWVASSEVHRTNRGRPHYNYTLAKPFGQIVQDVMGYEAERIRDIEENLAKLRDLASL